MARKIMRLMKRLALLLLVFFVLTLIYCNLPEHLLIRHKVSSLKKSITSYNYDSAWQLFSLEDSVRFILADESDSVREQLNAMSNDGLEELMTTKLYDRFLRDSEAAGKRLMESSRLFWNGFDEYRIDYDEPYDDSSGATRIVGISSTAPAGIEFDIYFAKSGDPIYPLPRSIFFCSLASLLMERGDSLNSYYYTFEAALDDAQFGQLDGLMLKRLLPIPQGDAAHLISWYPNFASLLDTIHTKDSLETSRKLITDAANSKLITAQERDALVSECDAISEFIAGNYTEASLKFQANLGAGLPGTAFYLALSAFRIGIAESAGANMLDISENLMKERGKKKRQE